MKKRKVLLFLDRLNNLVKDMDVLEAIKTRRSIRKYKEDAVPENTLTQILEAGRWAPSASNMQAREFVVLRDASIREAVAGATSMGKFLAMAPLGIVVVIDPKISNNPIEDGAVATQNMLLAIHSLGLGGCWIGAYNLSWERNVKAMLNIPKEKRLLSIIAFGYSDDKATSSRKELSEMVYVDQYGNISKA